MAESLDAEQIEERRKNLSFIRETIVDMGAGVFDDYLFTTTLVMQEEWLATVDALKLENAEWEREYTALSRSWDGLHQDHDAARAAVENWKEANESQRDANILRGLRLRECLKGTGGLALECQDCYDDVEEYCAPCYLRATHKPEGETLLPAPSIKAVTYDFAPLPLRGDAPRSRPTDITELELHSISIDEEPLSDNRPECERAGQGHVWVRVGNINEAAIMEWGDTRCLRCGIPVPVPDFDEEEPVGEDCCLNHSCPHHDGMQKNIEGKWYDPFYTCPTLRVECRDLECPHTIGMLKVEPGSKWR